MTLAFLLALLAPATAAAEPVVRAVVDWTAVAAGHRATADEVVAAMIEGSIGGSAVRVDAERIYRAEPGVAPVASRRAPAAARTRSSASSAVSPRTSTAAGTPDRVVSARVPDDAGSATAAERGRTSESAVGFGLLVAAGIAGALLFVGASRRTNAPARRR